MNTWTTDELKAALDGWKKEGRIHAYLATCSTFERQEFYLIQDAADRVALDQARQVDARRFQLQIMLRKANGRLGRAAKPLLPFRPLEEQLENLLVAAAVADEENWDLPAAPAAAPLTNHAFPLLREDFSRGAQAIQHDLEQAIRGTEGIFHSAELFVNLERTRRLASTGFDHEETRSRIYTEVCFSAEEGTSAEEFLVTKWYGHPEQVDLRALCETSRHFSHASLRTEKPQTGSYAVIFPVEVLQDLWNAYLHQLDSEGKYFRQPHREPGLELIPGFAGDAFDLSVDPKMPYSFASHDFDVTGFPQTKLQLATGNRIVNSLTSPRFAQYLKKPATSDGGCVVIEPARSRPVEELRKAAPKVLEILQFSALFADRASLTYSSEIRLARLHDNEAGTVTYIKGGNLSGNLLENFREVRWSAERGLVNHMDYNGGGLAYSGPAFALVTGVPVSS